MEIIEKKDLEGEEVQLYRMTDGKYATCLFDKESKEVWPGTIKVFKTREDAKAFFDKQKEIL